MRHVDLLNAVYKHHSGEIPAKYIVDNTLRAFCDVIAEELRNGGEVSLIGVGKLKVKNTAQKKGRNPKTGEDLTIPAGRRVVFKPGKELKEAMKN